MNAMIVNERDIDLKEMRYADKKSVSYKRDDVCQWQGC